MALIHRKNNKKDDPEQGDADNEQQQREKEQADRYENGNEYEILLRYVEDQAKLAEDKAKQGDVDDDKKELKRLWYAPWKKVLKNGETEKKVPEDALNTDPHSGLNDGDVESRRQDYGYNELTSPKENQFKKVLGYFRGPVLYLMEIAVILSAGLRDWIDFGVIIGILLLNASVGWYQEKQAGDIVASLKAGIALKAKVVRGGSEKEIEARELVPGDIIILEEGTTIPAEAKILGEYGKDAGGVKALKDVEAGLAQRSGGKKGDKSSKDKKGDEEGGEEEDKGSSVLSVDQSAITGESLAVDKFIGEVAYYTCQVKRGQVYAVVTLPAKQSFVGKTASLVLGSNERGHFEIVMRKIGTALLVAVFFFIFAMWIGGFFRGVALTQPKENNLLIWALGLFIIGVPVGLPCVSTTTLAVGAAYLAKQKAIVQKLTAIESLAGVDVLCTDKTGTLTTNKLSLNEPFLTEGVDREWFMTVAVLASSHSIKRLDPIDQVTIQALKNYPGAQENLKSGWSTRKFTPFDPVSKRITAEVSKDGKNYVAAKGAPNAILKLRDFDKDQVDAYKRQSTEMAKRGFRSLGVAVKEDGKDWELLGIMSLSDPPRSDTAQTIANAQDLGIRVQMITGDAVAIGKELARQLHMGTNILSAKLLQSGDVAGSDVHDLVEGADGFAEVVPEEKYNVVKILQNRSHLVAMSGDGVNDAPSLKKADCGIAVEGASDAARSAADVVFLSEGLSTIVTAFKVARQIFHRLRAYIVYRIALCVHLEVYLMLSAIILKEIIRVDLLVFLALFADCGTLAIAYDRAPASRKPVQWNLPKVTIVSVVMGLILAAGTWICRATMFVNSNGGRGIIQNYGSIQEVLFLQVALSESWMILITRCLQDTAEDFVWPSWQLVIAVFGVDILASFFTAYGWLSGPGEPNTPSGHTDIVTIIRIWAFSFGVILVCAFFYYLLSLWPYLDTLGQPKKKRDTKLEDLMFRLSSLSLVHGKNENGGEYFRFEDAPAKSDPTNQNTSAKKEASDAVDQDDQKKPKSSADEESGKQDAEDSKKPDAGQRKTNEHENSSHDDNESSAGSDATKH